MSARGSIWLTILAIVAAAGLYLLANQRVHLWDRDEPRYAQTSRQMLQSGDWVVPRLLDEVRTAKPVLIYWCQAGAMWLLGDTAFAARLPSVVGVVLTLILLAVVVGRQLSAEHALWTVVVLASSFLVIAAAKMCLTDGVLLLFITLAQVCCYALWRGSRSWGVFLALGLAIGLAILTKGPVVLGVLATTWVVLGLMRLVTPAAEGELRGIRRRRGDAMATAVKALVCVVVMAVAVAPWVYLIHQREPNFLRITLGHDVWTRMRKPLEGHSGPPGFYLLSIWGTFLPWSLLLPAALWMGWKRRAQPAVRFALAAAVGPWVMFELVRTKLPHYLLPVFPSLAVLVADALVECVRGRCQELRRPAFAIGTAVWSAAVLVGASVPWLAWRWFENLPVAAMLVMSLTGAAWAFVVFWLMRKQRWAAGAGAMAGGAAVWMAVFFGWYLPQAEFLRLPQRLAQALRERGAAGTIQMIEYKEPSLAFYQGGTIRQQSRSDQLARLVTTPAALPQWVVMPARLWEKQPADVRQSYEVAGRRKGLNYADGMDVVEVLVLRRR